MAHKRNVEKKIAERKAVTINNLPNSGGKPLPAVPEPKAETRRELEIRIEKENLENVFKVENERAARESYVNTDEYDENVQSKSRGRHTKMSIITHPKQSRDASSIKKKDHVYEEMEEDEIKKDFEETTKEGFHT